MNPMNVTSEALEDVPNARVGEVVQSFVDSGAISITANKQMNGAWSVIATFRA